jgi:hypothetical protein
MLREERGHYQQRRSTCLGDNKESNSSSYITEFAMLITNTPVYGHRQPSSGASIGVSKNSLQLTSTEHCITIFCTDGERREERGERREERGERREERGERRERRVACLLISLFSLTAADSISYATVPKARMTGE